VGAAMIGVTGLGVVGPSPPPNKRSNYDE
jgi:hypothetical protein